jgi:hypothetical protein
MNLGTPLEGLTKKDLIAVAKQQSIEIVECRKELKQLKELINSFILKINKSINQYND